jgi:hypothetical protein
MPSNGVNEKMNKGIMEVCIPSRKEVVASQLISVMGYDLFAQSYKLFRDVRLDEEHTYKVFMARKCYALYKAFETVLVEDGIELKGVITNDKMLGICQKDIQNDPRVKILVIDDTIIYGRTLGKFLERLKDDFQVKQDQITIQVLFASKDRKEKDPLGRYPLILEDDQNSELIFQFRNSKYKFWNLETSPVVFVNTEMVRGYSSRFIEAIHAVSAPYIAYIPAFRITGESVWRILEKTSSPWEDLHINVKGYDWYDISTEDSDKINNGAISAFCLMFDSISDSNSTFLSADIKRQSYLCVRIYVNAVLQTLTVIPHIILPAYSKKNSNVNIDFEAFNNLFQAENLITDFQTEANFIRFAASYFLGKKFFEEYEILEKDTVLIIKEGFGTDKIINDLEKSDIGAINSLFAEHHYEIVENGQVLRKILDEREVKQERLELENTCEQFQIDEEDDKVEFYFNTLSVYYERILIQDSNKERWQGLSITTIVNMLVEKYHAKVNDIIAAIVKICDEGRSNMYVLTNGNVAYSASQNGEQAAQILGQICDGFTYAVSILYSELQKLNIWEENKSDIKAKLCEYIDKRQTSMELHEARRDAKYMKSADAVLVIDSENPSQWHMDSVNYFIPNGTPDAELMTDFTYAYLNWIDDKNSGKRLLEYMSDESRELLTTMQIEWA